MREEIWGKSSGHHCLCKGPGAGPSLACWLEQREVVENRKEGRSEKPAGNIQYEVV
jgi:hypothetical protein